MKLLVSVVSAAEARAALRGGADVIDVKDPSRGALGAPSPGGDRGDRRGGRRRRAGERRAGDLARTPPELRVGGAAFVKAGLRGDVDSAVAQLRAIRDRVGAATGVVAAAYADAERCGALPPSVLPEVVARRGHRRRARRHVRQGRPRAVRMAHAGRARGPDRAHAGHIRRGRAAAARRARSRRRGLRGRALRGLRRRSRGRARCRPRRAGSAGDPRSRARPAPAP